MGFVAAVQRALIERYNTFTGRASRDEFWWFVLFVLLVWIAANVIDAALGSPLLQLVVSLALLVPWLAVVVRRLHDADRSGWWALLLLLPVIGLIALIVIGLKPGTAGENRFGPAPRPAPAG